MLSALPSCRKIKMSRNSQHLSVANCIVAALGEIHVLFAHYQFMWGYDKKEFVIMLQILLK